MLLTLTTMMADTGGPARVHGTNDPLVPFENGLRVDRAIPGSRLLALEGVGHDLPPPAAHEVLDEMIRLAGAV